MYEMADHFKKLLKPLEKAGAHIAGGAVRDTLLGRPVRDIDIFVGSTRWREADTTLRVDLGYSLDYVWGEEYFTSDERIAQARDYSYGNSTPVNLVVLRRAMTPEENLQRFDFGLCRVGHDGEKFIYTDDFFSDSKNSSFTLLKCENEDQFAQSMERYKRFRGKYENFSLVIPERFKKYAKEAA